MFYLLPPAIQDQFHVQWNFSSSVVSLIHLPLLFGQKSGIMPPFSTHLHSHEWEETRWSKWHELMHLKISVQRYFLSFGSMPCFGTKVAISFVHEAPGCLKSWSCVGSMSRGGRSQAGVHYLNKQMCLILLRVQITRISPRASPAENTYKVKVKGTVCEICPLRTRSGIIGWF